MAMKPRSSFLNRKYQRNNKHVQWPSWPRLTDSKFMDFPSSINDPWSKSDDIIREFDALYPRLGKSSAKSQLQPVATSQVYERKPHPVATSRMYERKPQSQPVATTRMYERKLQLGNAYKPTGIEINLSPDRKMEVRAKKEFSEVKNGCKCFVVEVYSQTVDIPENVDVKNIKALFNDRGELMVTAPILFTVQNKENVIAIKINKTK